MAETHDEAIPSGELARHTTMFGTFVKLMMLISGVSAVILIGMAIFLL